MESKEELWLSESFLLADYQKYIEAVSKKPMDELTDAEKQQYLFEAMLDYAEKKRKKTKC